MTSTFFLRATFFRLTLFRLFFMGASPSALLILLQTRCKPALGPV
jgi:hypothetical protein